MKYFFAPKNPQILSSKLFFFWFFFVAPLFSWHCDAMSWYTQLNTSLRGWFHAEFSEPGLEVFIWKQDILMPSLELLSVLCQTPS